MRTEDEVIGRDQPAAPRRHKGVDESAGPAIIALDKVANPSGGIKIAIRPISQASNRGVEEKGREANLVLSRPSR